MQRDNAYAQWERDRLNEKAQLPYVKEELRKWRVKDTGGTFLCQKKGFLGLWWSVTVFDGRYFTYKVMTGDTLPDAWDEIIAYIVRAHDKAAASKTRKERAAERARTAGQVHMYKH